MCSAYSCSDSMTLRPAAFPIFRGAPFYGVPGSISFRVDSFQADRSPTRMHRTAPLAGLWTHQKGGFFHDGRFATLRDVIEHYDNNFRLGLNDREKGDLIEYLKSL